MNERFHVLKFGGSSLQDPERVSRVLGIVEAAPGPTAVVVSAAGPTTDLLIEAAARAGDGEDHLANGLVEQVQSLVVGNAEAVLGKGPALDDTTPQLEALYGNLRKLLYGVGLLREYTPQTLDLIQSFGERSSALLMAAFLKARGSLARFVDARDWLVTDARFGRALVDWPATAQNLAERADEWREALTVHTGYLGRSSDGRTTTLGRNGSDYTATLLARGLGAEDVTIWTDVSGVMTADPGIVPDAYPLARLSYMEALELATFGAKMFHPRTMIPLIEAGVPLRIRNTLTPDAEGTLVDETGHRDPGKPTSVTSLENVALIDIQVRRLDARPRMAERIQRSLEQKDISVWLSTQSAHGQALSVVVPVEHASRAQEAIELELRAELAAKEVRPLEVWMPTTLLTLVAEAMGRSVNVAGRMFAALGAVGVNVRTIGQSASSRSISCIVDADETSIAVQAVHDAFNFAHQTVSLLVLGKGTVGSELLEQVASQAETLRAAHDIDLRLIGLADQRRLTFEPEGVPPSDWEGRLAAAPEAELGDHGPVTPAVLDRLRRLPVPVLVDVTAADGLEGLYQEAFERGIHVVAANKKPLTIDVPARNALLESARSHYRFYAYETTVGASLPVIETLKDLVRTGDRVQLIEGSFSGTLGYLTWKLMQRKPLAEAVREAKALGYTEPQPQDDLSGLDAARKALILARELGLQIELSDVELEPLVPEKILAETDLEAFYAGLEAHQPELDAQLDAYEREGLVLRYLARVDPKAAANGGKVMKVGPMAVTADHPATRLRATESFVAFTTDRYAEYPLIVQGAGAGGAVTAAGVLADVLRIAQTLRGR
ncbi:MAG: bifunctional aspartate kinase/homoserine dehydrogenase I [Myxococcota bacterium]